MNGDKSCEMCEGNGYLIGQYDGMPVKRIGDCDACDGSGMKGQIQTFGPFPFRGPVFAEVEDKRAHGNVCYRDEKPGFTRARNVNGNFEEVGRWVPLK